MSTATKILLAGALLTLAGCSCERHPPAVPKAAAAKAAAQKAATQKAATHRAAASIPLPSLRDQMRKIQRFTEELRRRVRGNVSITGPTKVVRGLFKALPINRYPKNFKIFYNSMLASTEVLLNSKSVGRDYNKLVERCVACHALHAQDYLGLVKQLRLPKAQWPQGAPPSAHKPEVTKPEVTKPEALDPDEPNR